MPFIPISWDTIVPLDVQERMAIAMLRRMARDCAEQIVKLQEDTRALLICAELKEHAPQPKRVGKLPVV